jgi:predicted permease
MLQLPSDVSHGARLLARTPGFTAVALATLAIGIGASSMVYSFVTATLASSSPPDDVGRSVSVWSYQRGQGDPRGVVSPHDYMAWRRRATSFDRIGAFRRVGLNLSGIDQPVRVGGEEVAGEYLRIVGRQVAIGRSFTAADESPGAGHVAVLGDRFWRDRFGGDPQVVGRTIRLDGEPATIIGVLAPRPLSPQVVVPMRLGAGGGTDMARSVFVFARLHKDASFEQAREEMAAIARALADELPDTHRGWTVDVRPLAEEFLGRNARLVFGLLLAAVTAVLLIGCANIANLMVARGLSRQRDLAIRYALGASRWRLVGHVLVESALLAGAGGVLGAVVAHAGLAWLHASLPSMSEVAANAHIGLRVLLFATLFSAVATLAFGLVPAFQGASPDTDRVLREASVRTGVSPGSRRLQGILVSGEVLLSVALLVVAGLLIRTLVALYAIEPGFDARGVLTSRLTLPEPAYATGERVAGFYRDVIARVTEQAAVVHASAGSRVPAAGSKYNPNRSLVIEGRPARDGESLFALDLTVAPGYFATLGIPLTGGRDFAAADRHDAPLVAIVNQTMARRHWGDRSPVGARLRLGDEDAPDRWRTVIGVAGDVRNDDIDAPPLPHVYVPHAQRPERSMTLIVRSAEDPLALAAPLRAAVSAVDPSLPLYDVATMEQIVREDLSGTRVLVVVLASFALSALLLAVIGIGGVLAQTVTQRVPEIGIRMALGATSIRVVALVLRQTLVSVGAGLALGLALAVALARLIGSILYGVAPLDPGTYAAAIAALLGSALVASVVPAARAARVDPLAALRHD